MYILCASAGFFFLEPRGCQGVSAYGDRDLRQQRPREMPTPEFAAIQAGSRSSPTAAATRRRGRSRPSRRRRTRSSRSRSPSGSSNRERGPSPNFANFRFDTAESEPCKVCRIPMSNPAQVRARHLPRVHPRRADVGALFRLGVARLVRQLPDSSKLIRSLQSSTEVFNRFFQNHEIWRSFLQL